MLLCMAPSTGASLGLSLSPSSPSGNTMCATNDHTNIPIVPSTAASRTRFIIRAPVARHYRLATTTWQREQAPFRQLARGVEEIIGGVVRPVFVARVRFAAFAFRLSAIGMNALHVGNIAEHAFTRFRMVGRQQQPRDGIRRRSIALRYHLAGDP